MPTETTAGMLPPEDTTSPAAEGQGSAADAQGSAPGSLHEAIRDALPKEPAEPPAPEDTRAAEGAVPEAGAADDKKEPDPEPGADAEDPGLSDTDKKLGAEAQKRIRTLLRDRRMALEDVRTLKPLAEEAQRWRGFMAQNDLSTDNVDLLLRTGAAIRAGDHETVLKVVEPIYQRALQALGRKVPDDLQQQVENGYLTEDAAKELGRARASAEQAEERARSSESRLQQERETAHRARLRTAAERWEAEIKARDAGYGAKHTAVLELFRADVVARGFPKTEAEVADRLNAIYGKVVGMFPAAPPAAPAPVRPTKPTPGSSPNAASARPEPRNMLEAISLATRGAG